VLFAFIYISLTSMTRVSILKDAEIKIDNLIDYGLTIYSSKKRTFFVSLIILAILFSSQILGYIDINILKPLRTAFQEDGFSSGSIAHAVSLGVCSGLSAPGFTMMFLLIMSQLLAMININLEPSAIAISAAINAALVVPDVYIWKTVFAAVGSRFISGGKYIRPFIGGVVPWALSVPAIYMFIFYFVHFLSVLIMMMK
jgi:CBS domain containing-hemolysin-like protein